MKKNKKIFYNFFYSELKVLKIFSINNKSNKKKSTHSKITKLKSLSSKLTKIFTKFTIQRVRIYSWPDLHATYYHDSHCGHRTTASDSNCHNMS